MDNKEALTMDNYAVVGKRVKNRDAVTKVTGKAVFAADMKLKGMLYEIGRAHV